MPHNQNLSPERIDPDELISSEALAAQLHVQPVTLIAWRNQRRGPPWVKIGRLCYYRRQDVARWVAKQFRDPETLQSCA